jgi:hypothetical protein
MENNIDERIRELKIELNHLLSCKFINELKFEQIKFVKQVHSQSKIEYVMAQIDIPKTGNRVKFSIGRKDETQIKMDDPMFKSIVLNKIKKLASEKFGC